MIIVIMLNLMHSVYHSYYMADIKTPFIIYFLIIREKTFKRNP